MRTPPARSMLPSLLLALLSGLQPAAASTPQPLDGAGQTVRRAVGASALDAELRWAGAFDALGRPVAEQDYGLAPMHYDYDAGLLAAEYFVDVGGALGDDDHALRGELLSSGAPRLLSCRPPRWRPARRTASARAR